ncbi:MAG: hypothetical protein H6739_39425 [Alphaproteobacteria bacterium]|nr:hypothetical protein [Alphaproteobacteria bacterium]
MERFLRAARALAPDLLDAVVGVPLLEIAPLAALYERPLPPGYLAFLRLMGRDHGGLEVYPDCLTGFDDVLEYTRDRVDDLGFEGAVAPDRFIIGVAELPGVDLCLQTLPDGRHRVVETALSEPVPVADSLPGLLCRQLFEQRALDPSPHKGVWAGRIADAATLLPAMAGAAGCEALWFSDPQVWCGARPDARVLIGVHRGGVYARVGANTAAALEQVGAVLALELGPDARKA